MPYFLFGVQCLHNADLFGDKMGWNQQEADADGKHQQVDAYDMLPLAQHRHIIHEIVFRIQPEQVRLLLHYAYR